MVTSFDILGGESVDIVVFKTKYIVSLPLAPCPEMEIHMGRGGGNRQKKSILSEEQSRRPSSRFHSHLRWLCQAKQEAHCQALGVTRGNQPASYGWSPRAKSERHCHEQ